MNNDVYSDVKNAVNLQEIIPSQTGFTMKGTHLEECPFCGGHDCFSIKKDFYKCFQCSEGGDIFTFLELFNKIGKGEALKEAAKIAGIELLSFGKPQKKEKTESTQDKIFKLTADYYHQNMLANPSAMEWFCKVRGHSETTLKKMQVGLADDKLITHLQSHDIQIENIVKYGLAKDRDKDGKEIKPKDYFWQGLAVFPVIDQTGKIISFTCKDPQKKYKGLLLQNVKKNWFLNFHALGKHDELFVVEGENDIASLIDIGCDNVVGTAGQPSIGDQVRLLRNFYSGKCLYLWFDRDKQKDWKKDSGGPHHIRTIYKNLAESDVTIKVITHPGEAKDPDEFIQKLLKQGKKAKEINGIIRELKNSAKDPLTWELEQLKEIDEARERLEAFKLRQLPQSINNITSTAEQEILINHAAKAIGISIKAVADLVTNSTNLYEGISTMFGGEAGLKKADPYRLASHIFKWFNNGVGARFFKTADKKVYLFYQRKIYEIGNNIDFNTLMQQLTRLAAVERPGSTVWYFLQNLCNMHGEPVDLMSWMHTDREKDIIYLNLNSQHNKIIKIEAGQEPAIVDNGTNEQSVLLSFSPQIREFNYQSGVDEAEGFFALKKLLMDTTPCDSSQRYFLICLFISMFLMNYQSDRALLQIIASSKIGKSKVAERISQLIYGESYVGRGTDPAATRVAIKNPIIFEDNLENKNLTREKIDFLLLLANSAHKPKAKKGSEDEVLYQKLNSMGIITSIEGFPGKHPELINRTIPLILEAQYRQHGYMHDEVMREILKKRNLILSSILKAIGGKVLPKLGERADWAKYIQTKFPGHAKDRNNEHICTIMIILELILEYIPLKRGEGLPIKSQASEILDRWINCWEEQEKATAISSNTLLTLMDGLAREICVKIRGAKDDGLGFQSHPEFCPPYPNYTNKDPSNHEGSEVKIYEDPEYIETFFLTEPRDEPSEEDDVFLEKYQRLECILTAAELFTLLNRYCANQHIRNPFDNPNSLGARISNDKSVMETGGWEYIQFSQDRLQYKKRMGNWYWRFSKKIKVSF